MVVINENDYSLLKDKGLIFTGINCVDYMQKHSGVSTYFITDELNLILDRLKGSTKKKITVKEIEEKLGYKIEIISE